MEIDYEKILQEHFEAEPGDPVSWTALRSEEREEIKAIHIPILEKHFREFEARVRLDEAGNKLNILCAKIEEKYDQSQKMLAKMQTKKFKTAAKKAFNATPAELGAAAVKAAKGDLAKVLKSTPTDDKCPQCSDTQKCNYCERNSEE